ncbi:MAG: TonB-dependent receptor [Candidatus Thiodiazotropha sp.]
MNIRIGITQFYTFNFVLLASLSVFAETPDDPAGSVIDDPLAGAAAVPVIRVESSTIEDFASSQSEASTINHIDSERVEEVNPRQINELLQTIPGITADVRPGEVVEIHMRGIGQQEYMWQDTGVAIVIDGVPIWQNGGKFRLNMSDIKSIKVIKGAASYLYGNTALGGAVIITTSRPMARNGYHLSAEKGSHQYKDFTAKMEKSAENFALNLNANYRDTDGYWVDSALWSKSLGGKVVYYVDDRSDLTLGVDVTRQYVQKQRGSTKGVTEAETNPRGAGRNAFQKENYVDLDKYFLTYSNDFAQGHNIMANLYRYLDEYDYISSPQDTDGDDINDTYTNHSLENILQDGIKLEYRREGQRAAYLLGFEHAKRNFEDASERLADYTTTSRGVTTRFYAGENSQTHDDQTKNALYGEIKYALTSRLTTTFNLRHDNQNDQYELASTDYDGVAWSDSTTDRERTFHENAYRLGAAYALSDQHTWYANLSTGFRTPTVDELFAGDIKGGNYINNESIKVRRSVNYEIGFKGRRKALDGELQYEVSLFRSNDKDIIGRKDGTYYSGDEIYFDNVGDAVNQGLEVWLKSQPSQSLSLTLAYTFLQSEYTRHNPFKVSFATLESATYDIVGNELPRTPRHTLDLYATYRLTSHWKLIGEAYARSGYYADETNLISMAGYAYANLQTRYETEWGRSSLELYFKVINLFDKRYYRTVFLNKDSNKDDLFDAEDATITVDPGREFYLGMIYRF